MSKHFIRVLRFPDGRFLDRGFDCADRFVSDPLDATPMAIFDREADTNEYRNEGAIVIEYEITATPTGRTCADIFKVEREDRARRQEEQRLAEAEDRRVREEQEAENTRVLARTLGLDYD